MQVVIAGDIIHELPQSGTVEIGSGIESTGKYLVAAKTGILRKTSKDYFWIETRSKRYYPQNEDKLIGVIVDKNSENFIVDIGGQVNAILPQSNFEGFTRRNRPNLNENDVVYVRVVECDPDLEPVLSCMNSMGKSGEFGHLKGGLIINITTSHARQMLSANPHPVLKQFGQHLQYEVCIGLNGRIWVNAPTTTSNILIANTLQKSEFLTEAQSKILVDKLIEQAKGQQT